MKVACVISYGRPVESAVHLGMTAVHLGCCQQIESSSSSGAHVTGSSACTVSAVHTDQRGRGQMGH